MKTLKRFEAIGEISPVKGDCILFGAISMIEIIEEGIKGLNDFTIAELEEEYYFYFDEKVKIEEE